MIHFEKGSPACSNNTIPYKNEYVITWLLLHIFKKNIGYSLTQKQRYQSEKKQSNEKKKIQLYEKQIKLCKK